MRGCMIVKLNDTDKQKTVRKYPEKLFMLKLNINIFAKR